jgi:hypothetical protein
MIMTKQNKNVMVYRLDYAIALMEAGFTVVTTIPNPQKPELITWVFEKSEGFDQALTNLVREGRRNE